MGKILVLYHSSTGNTARQPTRARRSTGEFVSSTAIWFDSEDCEGQAYISGDWAGAVAFAKDAEPPRYFLGDIGQADPIVTTLASVHGGGPCQNLSQAIQVLTATEVSADDLGLPWPGPLYIGALE